MTITSPRLCLTALIKLITTRCLKIACLKKFFLLLRVTALASIALQSQAAQSPGISQTLNSIALPDLSGVQRKLENWQGKTLLLNFWASWCTPCQYEIPHLVKYQKQYAEHNFQVVSIGLDEKRKLKNVKRSLGINYPVMVTSQQHGSELLAKLGDKQQIVPYTMIINSQGRLIYKHQGEFDDSVFELYVKPLLAVKQQHHITK